MQEKNRESNQKNAQKEPSEQKNQKNDRKSPQRRPGILRAGVSMWLPRCAYTAKSSL